MTGILQAAFVSCWHEEAPSNIPLEITVGAEDLGSHQVIRQPLFPLPTASSWASKGYHSRRPPIQSLSPHLRTSGDRWASQRRSYHL